MTGLDLLFIEKDNPNYVTPKKSATGLDLLFIEKDNPNYVADSKQTQSLDCMKLPQTVENRW